MIRSSRESDFYADGTNPRSDGAARPDDVHIKTLLSGGISDLQHVKNVPEPQLAMLKAEGVAL